METESRYLKKIRDVLRKKNAGSSSGTIYSGPNTKAKYLNDIAKEVDKLDISGGGSSESAIFMKGGNIWERYITAEKITDKELTKELLLLAVKVNRSWHNRS